MADILYTYQNQLYVNITNRCNCSCQFCIRTHKNQIGEAENLWFEKEPVLNEIIDALKQADIENYKEIVYCGYGEPTCALENLLASAAYIKENYGVKIRLNTNGLGNLYHGRNIVPELAKVIDKVSISLNAPSEEKYMEITRPQYKNAFHGMLEFAKLANRSFEHTQFSIVDVLTQEEQTASKNLADECGIYLRIRKYS